MAVWVLTVGSGRDSNWNIGRDNSIWATPKRSQIDVGDRVVFWQAVAGNGPGKLLGSALADETPQSVADVLRLPWPDSQAMDYRWSFKLRDIEELPVPIDMTWTQVREAFGVSGLPQQPRRADVTWPVISARLDSYATRSADPNEFPAATVWDLRPGDYLTRSDRQARFGGSTMGGIQPSNTTPNIFLYSDPTAGDQFGYHYDGWESDESTFLYTGEGQIGDQQPTKGNKAIIEHATTSRSLQLFVADGVVTGTQTKNQLYVGEFILDPDDPYARAEAPGNDGIPRTVFVFRLIPAGITLTRSQDKSSVGLVPVSNLVTTSIVEALLDVPLVQESPVEQSSGREYRQSATQGQIAQRREGILVTAFKDWLERDGHKTCRHRIRPTGELEDIWTDIYDLTDGILYEAKASSTRGDVRMAIGQLLDYGRFILPKPRLAVLLPSKPSVDILKLLGLTNILCVVHSADNSFRVVDI